MSATLDVRGVFVLRVGDFNRDGDPDLAAIHGFSSSVSILLGQAGAAFSDPMSFSLGVRIRSMAIGDFNRDGDPDMVFTKHSSDTVSVLLGGPGATFSDPTEFPAGADAGDVEVGDFNGDGDPDLVLAQAASGSVSILLGETGGTFSSPRSYAAGQRPAAVVISDFNGDGDPDLAVVNGETDTVAVLIGGPAGTFSAPTHFVSGGGPNSAAAGDFNGDGAPDLVVANSISDSITIMLADRPEIRVDDVSHAEGNAGTNTYTFTVTRTGNTIGASSVRFATESGTATAGGDYAPASGDLLFAPGETSKTFTVTVHGDTTLEPDESFGIRLSGVVNGKVADRQFTGTIVNDDLSASRPCTMSGTNGNDVLSGTVGRRRHLRWQR